MHLYLPTEQQKNIRSEYIIRLIVVFLIGCTVVSISNTIFLVPAYLLARSRNQDAKSELKKVVEKGVVTETKEIESKVKEIAEITRRFSEGDSAWTAVGLFSLVTKHTSPEIKIFAIDFANMTDKNISIKISGVSETRDTLISFKKELEAKENIQKVELPVSDLAKSKNIEFVMKISTK